MNRFFTLKAAVIAGLTFTLLSGVLLTGCRKKEQPSQTPPAKQQQGQEKQTQIPPMPPETNDAVPPPPPGSSQDMNKPAKSPGKEKPQAFLQGKTHPGTTGLNTMEAQELTLDKYDSITASEDKINFITEFSIDHPESLPDLTKKALDDKELDVRVAAMDAFVGNDPQGPAAIEVLNKAIGDKEEEIRLSAIEACGDIEMPETGKILEKAINDESDSVREDRKSTRLNSSHH
jgi:hypothetical protein